MGGPVVTRPARYADKGKTNVKPPIKDYGIQNRLVGWVDGEAFKGGKPAIRLLKLADCGKGKTSS